MFCCALDYLFFEAECPAITATNRFSSHGPNQKEPILAALAADFKR